MSHVRTARRHLHALRWRALSTSTDVSSPSHNSEYTSMLDTLEKQKASSGRTRPVHPRIIFVRPWDGIATMAHAFAIAREIERRFGKIQEFKVLRDPDVLSSLMPFMHATFAHAECADAIPPEGKVIQVVAPEVDMKRDGGIGLDELHVYLNPESREKALSDGIASEPGTEWGPPDQKHDKVMDVKLERTSFSFFPVVDRPPGFGRKGPPHLSNRMRTQELAHAIHMFGGFLDQPNHKGATLMQTVLSRWNRVYEQSPQINPAPPPKESVAAQNIVKEPEEPVPFEKEHVPWIPFKMESTTPELSATPSEASTAHGDLAPPASSPSGSHPTKHSSVPFSSPSSPSSPSKPIPESHAARHRSQPEPKSPATNVTSSEPKMSKKQRMLHAARLAGSMTVEKPSSVSPVETDEAKPKPTSTVSDTSGVEGNPEPGHDALEDKNKAAARKWWTFLTGGKG